MKWVEVKLRREVCELWGNRKEIWWKGFDEISKQVAGWNSELLVRETWMKNSVRSLWVYDQNKQLWSRLISLNRGEVKRKESWNKWVLKSG